MISNGGSDSYQSEQRGRRLPGIVPTPVWPRDKVQMALVVLTFAGLFEMIFCARLVFQAPVVEELTPLLSNTLLSVNSLGKLSSLSLYNNRHNKLYLYYSIAIQ